MCRLFGFRSGAASTAHRSLVRAENALRVQSREHPDGWGIGWWPSPGLPPQLERGAGAAFAEGDFERVARMVSAPAVIAHVRKASVGRIGVENAHPFRRGRWLFAHNGTLSRFEAAQAAIEAELAPELRDGIAGQTDSERCFALFLTRLAERAPLDGDVPLPVVATALAETVAIVAALADPGAEERSSTNFLVGDGRLLLACRRGRPLHLSTHKRRCSDRETCPKFSPECEAPPEREDGRVNHLILASERLSDEDVWEEVPEEGMVGLDAELRVRRFELAAQAGAPRSRATGRTLA